jgi:crotonobetainyl-CoA:carnitine CoA-transferase CaiB-like acyl-CoA transferase
MVASGNGASPGALAGLRVLELAEMIAGPYAAKLLADLGADVVKVEGPGGDPSRAVGPFVGNRPGPDRSTVFLHCNSSKQSVQLDLSTPEGRSGLAELAGDVDLVIADRSAAELTELGIGPAHLLAEAPDVVVLTLTPFGESGPGAGHKAYPLTTFHAGGEGYITPVASHLMPEVVDRPPLRQGRFGGEYKLATYAATLALAGVYHARATGVGQHIELSKQDALIGLNFFEFAPYLVGSLPPPSRASMAVPFGGIMPTVDGYVQFTFHEEHQWKALVEMMGHPAWADEPWCATEADRFANGPRVNEHFKEWLSTLTRAEVAEGGQARGVTVAPYLTPAEVVTAPQFVARGFFADVQYPELGTVAHPLGAHRFSGVDYRPRPAPRLGEHDSSRRVVGTRPRPDSRSDPRPEVATARRPGAGPGVLAGIRVVDFTWAVAGPTATLVLASLGAEVIKVETSLRLDVIRRSDIYGATTSRQKKAVTLNLRHPKAIELARHLVAVSDVVAESFRPGVMDKMGLGYDDLHAGNPGLVMLSSSMAGQSGPSSRFAGYAPMFAALSGLGEQTGYTDGPPSQVRVGADVVVGVHGAFALLAALSRRQMTGLGTQIDLSAIEAQACLIGDTLLACAANGTVASRTGNDEPGFAPHNCYRCAGDDQWVAVAVATDDEWKALVGALGDPAWTHDPRFVDAEGRCAHVGELDRLLGEWTATRTPADVTTLLQAAGVAASPAFRASELVADPHVVSRDLIASLEGPTREWTLVRLGGRLPASPLQLDRVGPEMGEHQHEVLSGLLGLDDDELAALAADGVFT